MRKTTTTVWILLSLTVLLAGCGNRKTVSEDPNGRITDNSTMTATETRATTAPTERRTEDTTASIGESLLPNPTDKDMTESTTANSETTEAPVEGRHRKPRMMDGKKF